MKNENLVLEESVPASGKALTEWQRQAPSSYVPESTIEKGKNKDELSLLDAWQILAKRKWTILTCLFITVVAVVTATFLTIPIYRSTLTLQIEREPAKVVQYQSSVENETDPYHSIIKFLLLDRMVYC